MSAHQCVALGLQSRDVLGRASKASFQGQEAFALLFYPAISQKLQPIRTNRNKLFENIRI
jgi:predicted Kef-type K+ transport protein